MPRIPVHTVHTAPETSRDGLKALEAIALAVAYVDGCPSCQAAHTAGGKAAGLSEEQMVAVRGGRVDFDPKLSALLDLPRDARTTSATT